MLLLSTRGDHRQIDLITFVVYGSDEASWDAYLDAMPLFFPRSVVGSPITELDDTA